LAIVIVPELALSEVIQILKVAKTLALGTWLGKHKENSLPLLEKFWAKISEWTNKQQVISSIFLFIEWYSAKIMVSQSLIKTPLILERLNYH